MAGSTKTTRTVALIGMALGMSGTTVVSASPAHPELPSVPPTCAAGVPEIVGTSASSVTVVRVPCAGSPAGVGYRIRAYEVGEVVHRVSVDLPNGQEQRDLPGVGAAPLVPGTAYRLGATSQNYAGSGPASALSPIFIPPFATVDSFTTRQYQDFTGDAPTTGELWVWSAQISSGALDPIDAVSSAVDDPYWQYQSAVTRLYQAYFLRLPDLGGLNHWTNKRRTGTTLAKVSNSFAGSAEFINRYGSLSNSQFVTTIYQNILGRAPDVTGLSYWTNQLNTGARTRGQVVQFFSESAENVGRMASVVEAVNVYTGMLRRMPTATEVDDASSWARAELIAALLARPDYAARPGVGVTAPTAPVMDYDALFTRFDQPYGWVGGDGGYSVRLPDGRDLWAFGDSGPGYLSATSPVNNPTGYPRQDPIRVLNTNRVPQHGWINNSMVLTRQGTNDFETRIGTDSTPTNPRSLIPPVSVGGYVWPGSMIVEPTPTGPVVRVVISDVGPNGGGGRFYSFDANTLAPLGVTEPMPVPDYAKPADVGDPTKTRAVTFGHSLIEDGGYIYTYGQWKDAYFGYRLFVARAPVGHLTDFDQWTYYSTGGVWQPNATDLLPVADDTTNSIIRAPSGDYLMFVLRHWDSDPVEAKTIRAYSGPSPVGPWTTRGAGSNPVLSYVVPGDESLGLTDFRAYLPLVHPDIVDPHNPNGVLLSWSNNYSTQDEGVPYYKYGYRPRFTWIDLSGL